MGMARISAMPLAHQAAERCLQGSISGQRDKVTRWWRKALKIGWNDLLKGL